MASELLELVPTFRNILIDIGEEGTNIAKVAESFSKLSEDYADFSSTFKQLETYVSANGEEGLVEISNALEKALSEGGLEDLIKLSGQEVTPELEKATQTYRNITKDIPERKIAERNAELESQTEVLESEKELLNEISENPEDVSENQNKIVQNSKLKSVSDFFDAYSKTAKSILITGIVVSLGAFIAVYISNYINAKSGCFLVTTDSKGNLLEQKIAGYSCKHENDAKDKILHPFDKEIKKYLGDKQICSGLDVSKFGPCAGWCTVGKNSRLSLLQVDIAKTLTSNKTLICRTATAEDAIFDLTNNFLKKVQDVVKDQIDSVLDYVFKYIKQFAPLIAIVLGLGSGLVSYFILKESTKKYRIIISLGISLFIAILFYFVINSITFKQKVVTTSYYATHCDTYTQCPSCEQFIHNDYMIDTNKFHIIF
jgi:hypothetical protein